MHMDIKKMKGKFRLVHMGTDIIVSDFSFDEEDGPFGDLKELDGGGFTDENEARAKRASEVSKKKRHNK